MKNLDHLIEEARKGPVQPVFLNLYQEIPSRLKHGVEVDVPDVEDGPRSTMRREFYRFEMYVDNRRERRVFIPVRVR